MGKEEYRIPVTGEAKKEYKKNFNRIDWSTPLSEVGRRLTEERESK